jgi:2-methylcitrate dehydratase PrpD
MDFSQQVAEYVEGVRLDEISRQEVRAAKLAIPDYLGVAMAGVGEGPDQALWGRIASCPGEEASGGGQGYGSGHRCHPPGLGDARSREIAELLLELENQDGQAPLMDLLTLRG